LAGLSLDTRAEIVYARQYQIAQAQHRQRGGQICASQEPVKTAKGFLGNVHGAGGNGNRRVDLKHCANSYTETPPPFARKPFDPCPKPPMPPCPEPILPLPWPGRVICAAWSMRARSGGSGWNKLPPAP